MNICKSQGLMRRPVEAGLRSSWFFLVSFLPDLIFIQDLQKWGGAGTLVPITGFANSVAAPAIEYQKEGQVFGIGCKIFIIAGPVILYGILTSALMGADLLCAQTMWNRIRRSG